jgi:hypothetical protein
MRLKRHSVKKTFRILPERPVPIIADAAIAIGSVGHGRLIPLVILDTTDRLDLQELIRVQQHLQPGDVVSQWSTIEDRSGRIGLLLTFKNPMELTALIGFEVANQGGLIDQIINTRGLYRQAGREGDRFLKNPNAPKLLLEIPERGFSPVWNDIFAGGDQENAGEWLKAIAG